MKHRINIAVRESETIFDRVKCTDIEDIPLMNKRGEYIKNMRNIKLFV